MDRASGVTVASNLFLNHELNGVLIGANTDNIDVQPNNVFLSSVGGWAAQSINTSAVGVFADTVNYKLNFQNYAVALAASLGSSIMNQKTDDYTLISGGDAILKGAFIQAFGQSHATVPRRGRLGSSPDGSNMTYPIQWETNAAGNASLLGFYDTAPIAKQTGVAVSAAGIHAALVNLGLIS